MGMSGVRRGPQTYEPSPGMPTRSANIPRTVSGGGQLTLEVASRPELGGYITRPTEFRPEALVVAAELGELGALLVDGSGHGPQAVLLDERGGGGQVGLARRTNDELPIAFVGTYPLQRCRIVTFTRDLSDAVISADKGVRGTVLAITDADSTYEHPARVQFEIRQGVRGDYVRAADFVNYSDTRMVAVPRGATSRASRSRCRQTATSTRRDPTGTASEASRKDSGRAWPSRCQ